ncbi:sulfotransferase 2B1-like [Ambystoma mexicanum]|uniref:sulfotransferase 2B1-like n=1 Tax=Ambystoma mexicanum TaxID=8296 RepID=UPI0037E8FF5E
MARLEVTEIFCGINFPGHLHTQESLHSAQYFGFQNNDIVIATYPKSGTTWMQEILTLIYSKGDDLLAKTIPNWERAPWLEQIYLRDIQRDGGGPRFLTTHLQYDILKPALKNSQAKVIYVTRNPKDVAVSFYHFHKIAKFLPDPGTFEEFLTTFLEGTVHYGSWFDHVKGWLGHKDELKLLCVSYENMKKDLRGAIKGLCKFLGCPMYPKELEDIERHCDFSTMSKSSMANYTTVPPEILDQNQGKFMRKGIVGDWKEHFTSEQTTRFDEIFKKEMQGVRHLCLEWDQE